MFFLVYVRIRFCGLPIKMFMLLALAFLKLWSIDLVEKFVNRVFIINN